MPTKTKPVPIYWDSCVFIAAIQREPSRWASLEAILAEAKDKKLVIIASVLVRAEVARLNQSTDSLCEQISRIAEFFENDFIELRDVTEETAAEAADIMRCHNVRPMDALHVATAIHSPCRVFHTYDGTTKKPSRTKAYLLDLDGKIGRPPLKVIQPQSPLATLPFAR
jgi:predicted nucleic acid-binding protein